MLQILSVLLGSAGEEGRYRTFSYFATGLAAGIAVALACVPLARIGRRFFILMSFAAIGFSALALAASGLDTGYPHVALAGLLILYNVIVPPQAGIDRSARLDGIEGGPRRGLALASRVVLLLAAACGAAGLVLDAVQYPVPLDLPGPQGPWLVASFLTSSLLLGVAATAMVLGHWYLVVKNLSFRPLARMTAVLLAAIAARAITACGSAWAQGARWESMVASAGWTGFFVGPGIFVLARSLIGILAPALFGWMTWKCVELRSNQSATGILYVILAFVLIGEIIAKYFLVSERLVI